LRRGASRQGDAAKLTLLPVEAVVPELRAALRGGRNAVLVAPPGAGKTTRVPLALLDEAWAAKGRIIVLEPRRLAARAAAARMAWTLNENVGDTVGFRVRLQSKVSAATRIEVVTEGIFTRMILADPGLDGVAAVLFDEIHERSMDADLGLALALDAQAGLREDLRLLAMSATLDGARFQVLMGDAPLVESQGRAFAVETRYVGRDARRRIEDEVADVVMQALAAETGSVLVFLPGAGEIRRTEQRLAERVGPDVSLAPLYGALEPGEQDRAIAPAAAGQRKVVLATSIAETSLTIEGVRVVIDSGLARVPRHDPALAITELVTERVSQAAADQRRGRAGRTQPGICYRLWEEAATRALPPFARPEILEADLAPLALALAEWGVADPATLRWLDPPPAAGFAEARTLLRGLDALDDAGRLTLAGKALAKLPLPPRLAHMILSAGDDGAPAADIAVLLTERGLGGKDTDIRHRLGALRHERGKRAEDARRLATNWARLAKAGQGRDVERAGAVLALGYPDRVAKARPGRAGEFQLANGRGAYVDETDALARQPYLAIAELAGLGPRARILSAAPLDEADLHALFGDRIETTEEVRFDAASGSVRARRVRRLDKLVLAEEPVSSPDPSLVISALLDGIRARGLDALPWTPALRQWRQRVAFLRAAGGDEWPDTSDAALLEAVDGWLGPYLAGKRSLNDIGADDLGTALHALLPHALARRLEAEAPTHFTAPTGSNLAVDYGAEGGPAISLRVQELFGLARHPSLAGGRVPLVLNLLSPAHRPIQITRDLPGFWRGSWAAVKSEMKGRYPRHPWPDDPAAAMPTNRVKPRGT